MADWNSNQYLKFKNQRTQPAVDLAMRVINSHPKTIADIGCGPGNSTAVLKGIFPDADILGVDNSPNMIEKAQKEHPDIPFCLCNALDLEGKYDLLFSNACLQWIPDHDTLIPALMDKLNDGGVLAVQIPMNGEEPLYKIIEEVAADSKWGLQSMTLPPNETLTPYEYFEILTSCSSRFDIWETKYYHNLEDHKALVEWVKGTRIRPYLAFLGEKRGEEFENEIVNRATKIYPVRRSGGVILGFRRFFFTAEK
ncbi:MAG TPA: methyltransferase domain-containing protein [Firmicutes bacterium]|nr:methyltransferase domain-containing protein [Bacillota bacterium]